MKPERSNTTNNFRVEANPLKCMNEDIKTFSEAIRLGSAMRPQAFYAYEGPERIDGNGSCALEAAWEAISGEAPGQCNPFFGIQSHFPEMEYCRIACPECGRPSNPSSISCHPSSICCHLNDEHRWTREQIADFFQSQGL